MNDANKIPLSPPILSLGLTQFRENFVIQRKKVVHLLRAKFQIPESLTNHEISGEIGVVTRSVIGHQGQSMETLRYQ